MNRTYALLPKLLTFLLFAWATTVAAQTRYWVGGDGRWEDVSHWSTTQDGAGGASVPRSDEDVVVAAAADLHIVGRDAEQDAERSAERADAAIERLKALFAR